MGWYWKSEAAATTGAAGKSNTVESVSRRGNSEIQTLQPRQVRQASPTRQGLCQAWRNSENQMLGYSNEMRSAKRHYSITAKYCVPCQLIISGNCQKYKSEWNDWWIEPMMLGDGGLCRPECWKQEEKHRIFVSPLPKSLSNYYDTCKHKICMWSGQMWNHGWNSIASKKEIGVWIKWGLYLFSSFLSWPAAAARQWWILPLAANQDYHYI